MWKHWRSAKSHFSFNILIASSKFTSEFLELKTEGNETTSDPNDIMPSWIEELNKKLRASVDNIINTATEELTGSIDDVR